MAGGTGNFEAQSSCIGNRLAFQETECLEAVVRHQQILVALGVLPLFLASPNSTKPTTHHLHVYPQLSGQDGESCMIMCIGVKLSLPSHFVYVFHQHPCFLLIVTSQKPSSVFSVEDPASIPITYLCCNRHKPFFSK